MTAAKTTLTPAEHANVVQGMKYHDPLEAFVKNEAATAATTVLASRVIRRPSEIQEIVTHMVDPGDGGANSDTFIEVKKNGTTVLSAPIGIADEATADTVVISKPASDALAKCEVGDLVTIETGADLGDVFVGLSVLVDIAQRFD